jgi:uncharacterized membrane protein
MRHRVDRLLRRSMVQAAALAIALAALLVVPGAQAQTYVVSELSPIGSAGTRAWDLNEAGVVVGSGFSPSLEEHALLWPGIGSPATDLTPTNALANARGVSNGGLVAGWAQNAGGNTEAMLWIGGQGSFLGTLPGFAQSRAEACNDSGLVCGWSTSLLGNSTACVWIDGAIQDIAPEHSWAFAVNESGLVVGRIVRPFESTAFRWQDGNLEGLPNLGPSNAQALGVSPAGLIAGAAESSGILHAVIWDQAATITDLGLFVGPSGTMSAQANDVNDAGVAAATAFITFPPTSRALVWRGAGLEDLNDLVPPGSGWTLADSQAINERGEIVGFGFRAHMTGTRAFLLRPDCDEDGLSDLDEIAAGTAYDANDDGQADACQHCQASLGFGGPGEMGLSICGDELTAAGSAATLLIEQAPPATPLYLVIGAVNAPTPLKGGVLVPTPPLLVVPGLFAGPSGTLTLTVHGGGGAPVTLYLQTVAPAGATAQFSNAVQLELGAP